MGYMYVYANGVGYRFACIIQSVGKFVCVCASPCSMKYISLASVCVYTKYKHILCIVF